MIQTRLEAERRRMLERDVSLMRMRIRRCCGAAQLDRLRAGVEAVVLAAAECGLDGEEVTAIAWELFEELGDVLPIRPFPRTRMITVTPADALARMEVIRGLAAIATAAAKRA